MTAESVRPENWVTVHTSVIAARTAAVSLHTHERAQGGERADRTHSMSCTKQSRVSDRNSRSKGKRGDAHTA